MCIDTRSIDFSHSNTKIKLELESVQCLNVYIPVSCVQWVPIHWFFFVVLLLPSAKMVLKMVIV